nr:hypothetical protein [Tanacetum cinerariifolium]
MNLCTRLSNKVLDLESKVIDIKSSFTDKIEKLKDKVHKLEEENRILKEKSFKSAKIDTAAPVEDKEESFKQGRMIADMYEDIEVNFEETQAKDYNLELQHSEKVLSMQDIDEKEPAEVEEVLEVVTAAKLITEVATTAEPTAAAQVPKASASRRRRGVVIQDPEETATSVIVHTEVQSKDKEATPLVSKVSIVDYQIHHENNKPYYKIIREDGSHKLFLNFITLLKNFDREDLETLWKLVKERRANMGYLRSKTGSCLNHVGSISLHLQTRMFLLVEKKYPLTYFTLEQMLNNVRLEVEEESEMSLELLRKFLRALPTKWCLKVVLEKSLEISKRKKEKYKSLPLKARKVLSEEEATSLDKYDEEYAMVTKRRMMIKDVISVVIQITSLVIVPNTPSMIKRRSLSYVGAIVEMIARREKYVLWISTTMSKAYIILNKKTMKIEESLNVKFDESPPPMSPPLEDDNVFECDIIENQEKDLEVKKNEPLNNEIINIKDLKIIP